MHQPAAAKPSPGSRRAAFHATALTPLLALGAAAAKLLSGIGWLQHRYEATTDIAYADGEPHKLDVYRPRGAAGAPVIVFFYGGKWQSGTKEMYGFLAAALTARGFVVVIPDYRLYPEVRFPDFIADSAGALRWTRDNIAAFGGDARLLFVMGHSAGAYIAAMLALDRQWLDDVGLDPGRDLAGLIGVSGPYDFLPLRDPVLSIIFGGDNRPFTQPISYAEGRKPPALILTGAADCTVAPGNSTRLAAKLRRGGNDVTERVYPRLGHFTILAGFTPVVASFLSPQRDLDAFVARIRLRRLGERQSLPAHAAVPAP
jgi:acetyl esterase/lipase